MQVCHDVVKNNVIVIPANITLTDGMTEIYGNYIINKIMVGKKTAHPT